MIKVEANKTTYIINDVVMGEVDYPNINIDTVNIIHTFVDPSLRGQGIADKLMMQAFKYLQEHNLKVVCTCSYAASWLGRHSEYQNLKVD